MIIRPFRLCDESSVIELWRKVFPATAPHHDPKLSVSRKLDVDPDLLLVALEDDRVIGTAMGGYDGHRGWIYSIAVDPAFRGRGVGSLLLRSLEEELAGRNCPKVNLQVRDTNPEAVAFFEKRGYSIEPRISMGKALDPGSLRRHGM